MKRVYSRVSVAAVAGGWQVHLDAKPLRTPVRLPLIVPRALAEGIAAEWSAQGVDIKPASMPLTQLASTAIDRVGPLRSAMVAAVAGYAETDLVCYRADRPPALVERQAATWQPLLDWLAARYDVVLSVHVGLMPRPQPPSALATLQRCVAGLDDLTLSGLQNATASCGSLVVALALLERRLDAEQAYHAAHVDELYQVEQWGEDAEAAARRAAVRADIIATRHYLDLLER
ncbi:MAG: ATP12 family protein [Azospirillaceae bacterium]|nr:ATP12 family protein [Azospirillaceae bacterium]